MLEFIPGRLVVVYSWPPIKYGGAIKSVEGLYSKRAMEREGGVNIESHEDLLRVLSDKTYSPPSDNIECHEDLLAVLAHPKHSTPNVNLQSILGYDSIYVEMLAMFREIEDKSSPKRNPHGKMKDMMYALPKENMELQRKDETRSPPKVPANDTKRNCGVDFELTIEERASHYQQELVNFEVPASLARKPGPGNKANANVDGGDDDSSNHDPRKDRVDIVSKAYDLDELATLFGEDGVPLKVDMDNVCVDLTYNKTKSTLNFRGRRFARSELELLSEAMRMNSSVKTLVLASCELNSKDVRIVSQFLANNASLSCLDLSHNYITLAGAEALRDVLAKNRALKALLLSKNYLGNDGCKVLLDMMKKNGVVSVLTLDYNGVDNIDLLQRIMESAEANTVGTVANERRNVHEAYEDLRKEHQRLKKQFKDYKRVSMDTMLTPQERLKVIMSKRRPRRSGKGNWKALRAAKHFSNFFNPQNQAKGLKPTKKRRKKKKKPKPKKQPQVIYISQSKSDEDESDYYEAQPPDAPADPFAGLRFV